MKYEIILSHLINGEANGLKVAVKPLLLSSIPLHQPHQKGASILAIQRIVIHIVQTHHKLRVGRERGWSTFTKCHINLYEVVSQDYSLGHTVHVILLIPGLLRQPPAVEPTLHIPSNW